MTPNPTSTSGDVYKVGPGCPPKETRFKPGQSGNPKGAKRKTPAIAPDLKALLEHALNKRVTLKQGEKEQIVTMLAAGIEQLVAKFANGDRHAWRVVIPLAEKLGIDLVSGQCKAVNEALDSNYQAILTAFVKRQYDTTAQPAPVLAPPELLDDDCDDQERK